MNTTTISEIDLLKQSNEMLRQQNAQLMQNIKLLQEQLEWLKKQLFGKKSERFVDENPNVLYLPGFSHEQDPPEVPEEKIFIPSHEKRKAKSTPINTVSFPEDLPVDEQVIDLPEEKKIDLETGEVLVCIGEDISTRLAKKPASYFLKRRIVKKYALSGHPEKGVTTADIPDGIVSRCAVDESIIADVLTKKFCDHLPLYRQAEMMLRDQIKISRQTLASYVTQSAKALKPLYDLLEKEVKDSGNIFVDETPVDVLAPGTGKTAQGYMVTMVGGQSLNPHLRVYKFFTSRKHEGFQKLFDGYCGVFHSDKYGAYEKEAKSTEKIWAPCWAHIRRKYFEAGGDSEFRKEVLLNIQELFLIEEEMKTSSSENRLLARQEKSVPIIDKLIEMNKRHLQEKLLPRSKLSGAIGYFLSLIPYLKNYIAYPNARLDNNVAERALKLVVIGRKNWMFVGSEGGGEAAAIIYSLAQSCRALAINPYDYFEDILRRIQSHPYNKLSELLPHNWKNC